MATDLIAPPPPPAAPAPPDRIPFLFGALVVYLAGITVRVTSFANPWHGVQCALIVDTFALLLVLANQRLMHRAQKLIRGNVAMAGYILLCATLSAWLVVLFSHLLALVAPPLASPWRRLPNAQFVYFGYLFLAWAVAWRWLEERARINNERLDAMATRGAALQSEMLQLRMQLSPHFLFNTLNMLAVDIPGRPRRALRVLRVLTRYLRYTLDNAERGILPAESELAGLGSYMRIQEMRHGAALKSSVIMEGSLAERSLPAFLLQPLVENATKHGVPAASGILEVTLRIAASPGMLRICVTNNGDLRTSSGWPGTGTGLANIRRRLALHYPGRHDLSLTQQGGLVLAALELRGEPC